MRLWRGIAFVLAAGLALGAAEANAAGGGGRLAPVGDQKAFPQRKWVLTLPVGMRPAAASVRIRENGHDVRGVSVVPGDAVGTKAFGVILVIDASKSMRGAAIEGAMSAARSFAARRAPQQRLGVVSFNGRADVLVAPSTDPRAIDSALAGPPALGRGTLIHDAVASAIRLLGSSGIEAGSVVVLSDGSDSGSRTTEAQAAALARRHGVRVFGVGLRSRAFNPAALQGLAAGTGGTATFTSSPRALRRVFDALGARLANQFIVRYSSRERGRSRVRVEADVDGGAPEAIARYLAPLPAPAVSPDERRRVDSFWLSDDALTGVALLCALLVALAAGLLVRRPPGAAVRARLAWFASAPSVQQPAGTPRTAVGRVASIVDRRLGASGRWQRFGEDVDVARIKRSPAELAVLTGGGSFVAGLLLVVADAGRLVLLPLLPLVGVALVVRLRAARQRRAFEDQLPDNLQVLGSALRAGHSFTGALGAVVGGAPEPIRRELARVQTDEQLGVPIDEALLRTGRRMRTKDVDQVAVVAALQQETGGNTAEVLDRVVEALRERHALRRLVKSLTAQGRVSQFVVTGLPVGLGGFIAVINPGYLDPLFATGIGRVMLVGAVVMIVLGAVVMQRIVNIRI